MPCNAFNHPPHCNCGWGPKDTIGAIKDVGFEWTKSLNSYESFVNPNARCPKCKKLVYFYRSPHNGSVYFDKLGPPWDKHPCMDQNQLIDPPIHPRSSIIMTCPPPDEDGWRPLLADLIKRKFGTFYLKIKNQELKNKFVAFTLPLAGCSPIYWRYKNKNDTNNIEFSLMNEGKFGDIKIWQDTLPIFQSYDEARKAKISLLHKFVAN